MEFFSRTHDLLGGQLAGLYDEEGNAKRGMSKQEEKIRDGVSKLALIPSAPFGMAEFLPPEVWKAISIFLKNAK